VGEHLAKSTQLSLRLCRCAFFPLAINTNTLHGQIITQMTFHSRHRKTHATSFAFRKSKQSNSFHCGRFAEYVIYDRVRRDQKQVSNIAHVNKRPKKVKKWQLNFSQWRVALQKWLCGDQKLREWGAQSRKVSPLARSVLTLVIIWSILRLKITSDRELQRLSNNTTFYLMPITLTSSPSVFF
jgi:hypothetical protein